MRKGVMSLATLACNAGGGAEEESRDGDSLGLVGTLVQRIPDRCGDLIPRGVRTADVEHATSCQLRHQAIALPLAGPLSGHLTHSPSIARCSRLHSLQRFLHVGLEQLHSPNAPKADTVLLEEAAGSLAMPHPLRQSSRPPSRLPWQARYSTRQLLWLWLVL